MLEKAGCVVKENVFGERKTRVRGLNRKGSRLFGKG